MVETEMRMIPIEQIVPNPFQPRETFEKDLLEELGVSIKEAGLLQPILVRRKGNSFQIIAGERRWRAYQLAGLKTIPAVIREADDIETRELSLVENWHRLALKTSESEKYIFNLYKDGIKTGRYKSQNDMAKKTGINQKTLSDIITAHQDREQLRLEGPLSYVDFAATRPLKEEPKVRKQVLRLREEGKLTLDELRDFTKVVEKAPEPVRQAALKPQSKITPKVAEKLLEIPEESKQKAAIAHITAQRLDEETSLKFIERVKEPENLIVGVERVDEVEAVLSGLEKLYEYIMGWGVNQYMILSRANKWNEALAILDKIEEKIRELRTRYA